MAVLCLTRWELVFGFHKKPLIANMKFESKKYLMIFNDIHERMNDNKRNFYLGTKIKVKSQSSMCG